MGEEYIYFSFPVKYMRSNNAMLWLNHAIDKKNIDKIL